MYWNLVSLRIVQWIHISSLAYSEPTVPIVRPVCTKSKCNAGADRGTGSDTKDENLNFLVVGGQETVGGIFVVTTMGPYCPNCRCDNNHIQWHWPWKLSLRNTLCSRKHTGGVIERGSLLSIEFWCRNSVHINNLVFSRRSDHCPMITRRVMSGDLMARTSLTKEFVNILIDRFNGWQPRADRLDREESRSHTLVTDQPLYI